MNNIDRILYMLWTGDNEMSTARKESVRDTKSKCNVEFKLLFAEDIKKMEKEDFPFHPAYEFLSETHKADYIRCYLMHNYGGGYADIKLLEFDWNPYFNELEANDDIYAIGYPETSPLDLAIPANHPNEQEMRSVYPEFIGNCNYIFKKKTEFTTKWINQTHKKLDEKYELLKLNPATYPQDVYNGSPSSYPLGWSEILGQIFHPLVFEYKDKLSKNLPQFTKKENYR